MAQKVIQDTSTAVVSTNDKINVEQRVEIYPNPMQNSFEIKSTAITSKVQFLSVRGQKIALKKLENNHYQINETISKGAYVVQVFFEGGSILTKRVVVID